MQTVSSICDEGSAQVRFTLVWYRNSVERTQRARLDQWITRFGRDFISHALWNTKAP